MVIVSLFGVFCCLQNWIMSCNKSVLSQLLCCLVVCPAVCCFPLFFSFACREPSRRTNFHRSHIDHENDTIFNTMHAHLFLTILLRKIKLISLIIFLVTVEPRFNEVPRDWTNWFVISRVSYIEKHVTTNLLANNQSVRYVGV